MAQDLTNRKRGLTDVYVIRETEDNNFEVVIIGYDSLMAWEFFVPVVSDKKEEVWLYKRLYTGHEVHSSKRIHNHISYIREALLSAIISNYVDELAPMDNLTMMGG